MEAATGNADMLTPGHRRDAGTEACQFEVICFRWYACIADH